MCGRYDNLIARDAYRPLFRPTRLPQSNFPPRYNIAPTDPIPIIRVDPRDGERELVMARWGLVSGWMKQMPKLPHINARAETVHEKPLFKEAFARRRALIPELVQHEVFQGKVSQRSDDLAQRDAFLLRIRVSEGCESLRSRHVVCDRRPDVLGAPLLQPCKFVPHAKVCSLGK